MRKRLYLGFGATLLVVLASFLVWQGSFELGEYGPASPAQTVLLWVMSTLVFLLTVTLGFMLFRTAVKLYIERQRNREGSRLRVKLLGGAFTLLFVPVIFLVLFDYLAMNRNLRIWFTRPNEGLKLDMVTIEKGLRGEFENKVEAQARWLSTLPEVEKAAEGEAPPANYFALLCEDNGIAYLRVKPAPDRVVNLCTPKMKATTPEYTVSVQTSGGALLMLTSRMPVDIAQTSSDIQTHLNTYNELSAHRTQIRNLYWMIMAAITLFVLFVATWIARILADQIGNPIAALLKAAGEVRRGNLAYRVNFAAIDELATLIRAFNEMMRELEGNSQELEARRRFTEAILESIPTGVISLAPDGQIQRVNRALRGIFPAEQIEKATQLRDLFSAEDSAEIRYLMKRARRTGVAATQMEYQTQGKIMHLAVTVSALEERPTSGFVMVIEDTSELLRAQKATAWQEVARRIAHEIKNPLTPIGLSAERIARQIEKGPLSADAQRIVQNCSVTIAREVESVKLLVDEFSQFARFPTAQPVRSDLNEIVRKALAVFHGRLEGVKVHTKLSPALPVVNVDPEQFKRVVVNLVDNAAEAMHESMVRELWVETHSPAAEIVELVVADTGHGISPEEKEKLFLPYFSTKSRGTGLGLAIVSRIIADHGGSVRAEENKPAGARFIVELPAAVASEPEEERVIETRT